MLLKKKKLLKRRLGIFIKVHCFIDLMTILVTHQAAPTFYNKIAPMQPGIMLDCSTVS